MTTSTDPRQLLLQIFHEAVQAVNGAVSVRRQLAAESVSGPVHLLAMGKAACAMARGAHEVLGATIQDAFIVTKRGYAEPLPWPVMESGHPLPDAASLEAGERLDAFMARVPETATVLVLLSGGASALIEQLPPGMTLADLQRVNEWLLGAGLDIHAMNAVRKRLSRIKGGRLAQRLWPRPVICLAISDVPGDDPHAIGSGPLTPDPAPLDVARLPEFLKTWLAVSPPLPASDDPAFDHVRFTIVARNADACTAAARAAEARGVQAAIHPGWIDGDAAAAGARLAHELLRAPPGVVQIWGGETTVQLPVKPGRGGRCQTLALAAARAFAGREQLWLLAAGTDGTDGPGDDAGALIDGTTVARAALHGFDAGRSLAAADAGALLEASGDLIQTGATGTNVMDLVLGLRL